MDAQTAGILPMEKVRRPVMIAYNAENSFISGFIAKEYEETDQDDVHEDEDDSENISKSEWDVQCNSDNERSGSIKRDNNLATGPGGGWERISMIML